MGRRAVTLALVACALGATTQVALASGGHHPPSEDHAHDSGGHGHHHTRDSPAPSYAAAAHGGEGPCHDVASEHDKAECLHDLVDAAEDEKEVEHEEHMALEVAVLLVLFVISIAIGQALHEMHVYWLPESGATILVGMAFGVMVKLVDPNSASTEKKLYFDPELFNLFLLPPIIFESGFSINQFLFFRNLGTISVLAVGGTLIAILFTWACIYNLSEMEVLMPLSGAEAGAFAALISAVDPVATLSTFGALGVDPKLNNLVFGESVLNDAVSLIAFRSILHYGVFTEFSPSTHLPAVLGGFVVTGAASILYGVGVGIALALMLKGLGMGRHGRLPAMELAIFWAMSYFSFVGAEVPHLSGIVASLFAGITMRRYALPNMSPRGRLRAERLFKVLSVAADTVVFLLVGLAVVVYMDAFDLAFNLVTLVVILAGRALNIFPLLWLANLNRTEKVTHNEQVVMWWSGLRGAIAVALAVQMPGPTRDPIVSCTMSVVLFTIFVFGGTTKSLLDKLKIEVHAPKYDEQAAARELTETERVAHRHVSAMDAFIESLCVDNQVLEPLHDPEEDVDYDQLREELEAAETAPKLPKPHDPSQEDFVKRQKERSRKTGHPLVSVSGF